jgi:hypothetical protein
MANANEYRGFWEERGNNSISLKKRPSCDLDSKGNLLPLSELEKNIKERFKDFSIFLEDFYQRYLNDYDLYSDKQLAFIGNELFRNWPWIGFPFTSKAAKKVFEKHGIKFDIVGLMDADIGKIAPNLKSNLKDANKEITYEHWTPLSFFRDVFIIAKERNEILDRHLFYEFLCRYYRTVRITKEEDSRLNKAGYKSNRPITAYDELGIEIEEKAIWDTFLI